MNIIKHYFISLIIFIGKFWSIFYSLRISNHIKYLLNLIYTGWISKEFKSFGSNTVLNPIILVGGKYITIGNNCIIGKNTVITAWSHHQNDNYNPEISIGNYVEIGSECHITAINRIEIGDNVLTGKKVTITDNTHGKTSIESFSLPPSKRKLISKGAVIIEEGVWIGDKVTILSNVRIGKNSIIGANSVVTHDIPTNCVAAGIPARVVKTND